MQEEMKEKAQTAVAVAIIKNEKGEYLLIKSSKDFGEHTGKWYPPGGHLKPKESVENSLKRELKEELNLEIDPQREIALTPGDIERQITHWWECEMVGGSLKKADELLDAGFYSPDEIREMNLWPATRKFFEEHIWK